MSIDSFTARAIRVLFSSEYSEAEYIIVSIGLFWLFNILSIALPDQELGSHLRREDLVKEGLLCRENLETSLSTLPFNLPSDHDHVEALIMAVRGGAPACVELPTEISIGLLRYRQLQAILGLVILLSLSAKMPQPGSSPRSCRERKEQFSKSEQVAFLDHLCDR